MTLTPAEAVALVSTTAVVVHALTPVYDAARTAVSTMGERTEETQTVDVRTDE